MADRLHPTDLIRELTKARVALSHAGAYLQNHNRANAVLHLAPPEGVMWSPLTTEVVNAHQTLGHVIERLQAQHDAASESAAEQAFAQQFADDADVPYDTTDSDVRQWDQRWRTEPTDG